MMEGKKIRKERREGKERKKWREGKTRQDTREEKRRKERQKNGEIETKLRGDQSKLKRLAYWLFQLIRFDWLKKIKQKKIVPYIVDDVTFCVLFFGSIWVCRTYNVYLIIFKRIIAFIYVYYMICIINSKSESKKRLD